jgi:hypothetical protein
MRSAVVDAFPSASYVAVISSATRLASARGPFSKR